MSSLSFLFEKRRCYNQIEVNSHNSNEKWDSSSSCYNAIKVWIHTFAQFAILFRHKHNNTTCSPTLLAVMVMSRIAVSIARDLRDCVESKPEAYI
jgi:hypothetical protein